jgi:hypothetical protein
MVLAQSGALLTAYVSMNLSIRVLLFTWVGSTLMACGDDGPPMSQVRRDVPLSEILDPLDASLSDVASDLTVAPPDGDAAAALDMAPATDAPITPPTDTPRTDAPAPVPGLCGLTPEQMNLVAVRIALCTGRPAQQVLAEFYRPDSWETGPFTLRPCPSIRCIATTGSSCNIWMINCLKYNVATPKGGVCAMPPASCEGSGNISRNCAMGRDVRDDCSVGSRRCVATAAQSACVARSGETCAAGAAPRCVGAVLEECVLGTYTPVRNCALTGSVCDATARGCRGTGEACTGDATACDGTMLRVCRNGRWQNLDCGRLVTGTTCRTVMGRSFCGVDLACDPGSAPMTGTCDGNTLSLCAGGRTFRYTCEPANGFASCGPSGCIP